MKLSDFLKPGKAHEQVSQRQEGHHLVVQDFRGCTIPRKYFQRGYAKQHPLYKTRRAVACQDTDHRAYTPSRLTTTCSTGVVILPGLGAPSNFFSKVSVTTEYPFEGVDASIYPLYAVAPYCWSMALCSCVARSDRVYGMVPCTRERLALIVPKRLGADVEAPLLFSGVCCLGRGAGGADGVGKGQQRRGGGGEAERDDVDDSEEEGRRRC